MVEVRDGVEVFILAFALALALEDFSLDFCSLVPLVLGPGLGLGLGLGFGFGFDGCLREWHCDCDCSYCSSWEAFCLWCGWIVVVDIDLGFDC